MMKRNQTILLIFLFFILTTSIQLKAQNTKVAIPIPFVTDSISTLSNKEKRYFALGNNHSWNEMLCVTEKGVRKSYEVNFGSGLFKLSFFENGYDLKGFQYFDSTKKELWAGVYKKNDDKFYYQSMEFYFKNGNFTAYFTDQNQKPLAKIIGVAKWKGNGYLPCDLEIIEKWVGNKKVPFKKHESRKLIATLQNN